MECSCGGGGLQKRISSSLTMPYFPSVNAPVLLILMFICLFFYAGAMKAFAREVCRNDVLNFGRLHFFFPDSRLALDLNTDRTLKEVIHSAPRIPWMGIFRASQAYKVQLPTAVHHTVPSAVHLDNLCSLSPKTTFAGPL